MGTEPNPADHPSPETAAAAELEQTLFEVKRVIVGPGPAGRAPAGGVAGRRPLPARRCAGGGQDAGRVDPGHGGRRHRSRGSSSRPDLVPSDIVGTRIYRASKESFDVELGPIMANLVLADEINRAPAKVQSALLEAMAERQVSIGGRLVPGARPVPGAGHAEPDRVRGRLPPAGGAAGPVPDEGRRRLPDRRRGAGHPLPDERRAAGRRARCSTRTGCAPCRR